MPIFEYECSKGHRFDVKFDWGKQFKIMTCPKCRQMARRVFSPFIFSFKGGI